MKKVLYKTNQNNPVIKAYKNAVEKGKKDQHIFPLENGGWVVKSLLSPKKSQAFDSQLEAATYATTIAQNKGTAVFVHGQDGRIKDRKDYSTSVL